AVGQGRPGGGVAARRLRDRLFGCLPPVFGAQTFFRTSCNRLRFAVKLLSSNDKAAQGTEPQVRGRARQELRLTGKAGPVCAGAFRYQVDCTPCSYRLLRERRVICRPGVSCCGTCGSTTSRLPNSTPRP